MTSSSHTSSSSQIKRCCDERLNPPPEIVRHARTDGATLRAARSGLGNQGLTIPHTGRADRQRCHYVPRVLRIRRRRRKRSARTTTIRTAIRDYSRISLTIYQLQVEAERLARLAPLVRRHGVVCENQVAVVAACLATGLAIEHLDQIPVHAAVVVTQTTGECRHVGHGLTSARNRVDYRPVPIATFLPSMSSTKSIPWSWERRTPLKGRRNERIIFLISVALASTSWTQCPIPALLLGAA